jgi:hypothetical protein
MEENWSRVPDSGLAPGQTGRLTVDRKMTEFDVALTCGGEMEYLHYSPASSKCDIQILSRILRNLDLRMTALARPSSNCSDKLQTRPLVREDSSQEETRKFLIIFSVEMKEIFFSGPRWPDTRTD